jgi:plastocyanin
MRRTILVSISVCLTLLAAGPGDAAKKAKPAKPVTAGATAMGSIRGTVVLHGRIKKVKKKFNPYADIYGGGAGKQAGKSDEPGHLCVYLEGEAGSFPPPAEHAVLDQQDRAFTTDLLPILVGTSVDFTNHDRIYHNVFSYSEPQKFDLGRRGAGEMRTVVFDKLPPRGPGVLLVNCEIHTNMHATILVLRNPFWAVLPETGGAFEIRNVPPGTYTLTGYQGSLKPLPVTVKVTAGQSAQAELVMQGED